MAKTVRAKNGEVSESRFIEVYNNIERYPNSVDVAAELGIAYQTVRNRANIIRNKIKRGKLLGVKLVDRSAEHNKKKAALPTERLVYLQDKVARLQSELKTVHRSNLEAEQVRRKIFGLAESTPKPPSWLTRRDAKKISGVTGVPCTIWSDWHLGETVRRAEVNGVNEFNLEIAEKRIERLVRRTGDLCFNHMTNPNYPGIVVALLGDIVSGEIHTELSETNEDYLFPVILWARDRIIAALVALADQFGHVFVACAPGNHGRMTKKPQAKRYVVKNADWLIYNLLERYFLEVGDDRVQFSIPSTGEVRFDIYSHRYLGIHGDDMGVKGGDGIIGAIGPIMRGEIKVHHSQAQIGLDYDTLLMGHWHQELWLPRAIVNNTLKGYDEFARRMLRAVPTPPSQNLWFTHPTKGITARWGVYLDDHGSDASGDWVTWRQDKTPYHAAQASAPKPRLAKVSHP